MNWKLVFMLSLLGLCMAVATVFWIPESKEFIFWAIVLLFSAWVLARSAGGRYFVHGVAVGLANCVWVTAAHVYWFTTYSANHPKMMEMNRGMSFLADHPRRAMLFIGPLAGLITGTILGLVTLLAVFLMRKKVPAATA